MIDALAIERLKGSEREARGAFDAMSEEIERYLSRYLTSRVWNAEAREDAVSRAMVRLWQNRHLIQAADRSGFLAFVSRIAVYCGRDIVRERGDTVTAEEIPDFEEIPDADLPYLEALAVATDERDRIWRAADELWLYASQPSPEIERRVFAAQLFYLHRRPWDDIVRLVGPMSREDLDEWLADVGTINYLAFRQVYGGNDALCAHLLDCSLAELDRIAAETRYRTGDDGPGGWTWPEARVVVLRYRNALTSDQIGRQTGGRFDEAELSAIFGRCREKLPFRAAACRVLENLGPAAREVARSGIGRRLAFQYFTVDDLPLKQISERTEPALQPFGASPKAGTLNMWLSGGRLYSQLAKFLAEEKW